MTKKYYSVLDYSGRLSGVEWERLVKLTPFKELPTRINHKVYYVRWAVKRRLENKPYTVPLFFYYKDNKIRHFEETIPCPRNLLVKK